MDALSVKSSNHARILVVDDEPTVVKTLEKILTTFDYQVSVATSGEEALARLSKDLDLIILDITMPGMDGFQTLQGINQRDLGIPVIFLTGAHSMDFAIKAVHLGAYDFLNKPIVDFSHFHIKVKRALEKRLYVLQERAYRNNLEHQIRDKTRELAEKNRLLEEYSHSLEVAALDTMLTLQTALEEKDIYTAGHTLRVSRYAVTIAQAMQLPASEVEVLKRACQVHDIGKLVIDTHYINKQGPLSAEEWEIMRKHPIIGENIIKPLSFMQQELSIVCHHHERMDGKGYPDGLGGDELDHLTRIITVADSYDAMTSQRSYRANMTFYEAIDELHRCSGTQFDPETVEVFVEVLQSRQSLPASF